MKLFLSLVMMMTSFMMFFLNHPLSMGMMILMQTILTCLISGLMINNYWFSYILFLTFLGGLLVLFIYVSSIASNEIFKNNFFFSKFFIISLFMILLISIYYFFYYLNWSNNFFNEEMNNLISNNLFFNNENKYNLSKLYNNQTFLMMMMMIIYLFITLVAVVKITNIFFGPLRSST